MSLTLPQPTEHYYRHVNLELTTACDLKCPDCAAGMTWRKPVHHPWEYFVEAAKWIKPIEILTVIGGEPTLHPKFAEFVPKFRELFGVWGKLILWTDGWGVEKYKDLIAETFDVVHGSLYDEHTAPWNKRPNTEKIILIKNTFNHATMEEPHVPRTRRGSGRICDKGMHGPITYADGKFYGCCVAMGYPEGIGVVPSPTWREDLLKVPLPCDVCMFSPE